jgi:hypothetical protein
MVDRTPLYLRLVYEKWFDDHPGARAELENTTVRQHMRPGGGRTFVKNTPGGEVQISEEEFDARYWARERGPRT